MITVRSWAVYGMLAAIWGALLGWQVAEHIRVSKRLQHNLIELGHARTSTCAKFMRSRRASGGVIGKERLEGTLNALIDTNEFRAVELLNNANEVVASAGNLIALPPENQ